MRIAELLTAMANWLESPNNEALLLSDGNDQAMKVVAESCVLAAQLLKSAAEEVDSLEAPEPSLITPESIEETAALAHALDGTNDPALKKMASVLDELLLTIAAPKQQAEQIKAKEAGRIEELRKKYEQPRKDLHAQQKVEEHQKAIDKSGLTKHYEIQDHPLQTRNCPAHFCQMSRVGEGLFQCELGKETYDFRNGYEVDGKHVPGGDVALQSGTGYYENSSLFDTRNERLGQVQ